jgi:signal transduction histidine kinase
VQRERLATLGQVSGGIGHELRNPLGVMSNAVYYLEATLRDAPPKAREYLGVLRRQIATTEQIVTNLLGFARAKPPLRQAIHPEALVEEQLARVAVPPSIRVERQLECDLPAVSADPVQVGQVLVNVLTNAVQAMEEGGGVMTVRATRGENGTVRITVQDTGSGVPAELADRIFEPLFTTKARGMGLGLAVSRTLARVNGGDLYVNNGVPRGAAFTLELPIREPS